ncbi:MAG TPA: aminotransferase class I/II-fold pyridoxal phosphate-dependent enzyme [Roseiflexaceae bacterium]|nr:aminotransferase class I/II-fold pyridoxal phosphate-dependent enzyme [Roseiflexaceae bacterium]
MSTQGLWYEQFFTDHYWRFSERRSPPGRVSEVAGLAQLLERHAPGRLMVDLGCGTGGVAAGLAMAGMEVVGVDQSAWALAEAVRRFGTLPVRWARADLLTSAPWPFGRVDAAVCLDAFGWAGDADQRRMLIRLRRVLAPEGVLVLVCPDALRQPQGGVEEAEHAPDGARYRLRLRYDPLAGRLCGGLSVAEPGHPEQMLPYDLRLYTPAELAALVRAAGFRIDSLAQTEAGTIQIVARPLPAPPQALAVASWRTPDQPALDLRYNPDETAWQSPSSTEIWQELIRDEAQQGAAAVSSYPVNDPYGAERGAPVVGAFFGCPVEAVQLTFAAGVTALLRDLAGLAEGGLVLAPQLIHPDLSAWALGQGCEVRLVEEPTTAERLIAAVEQHRPALVSLDRPSFVGDLLSCAELGALCQAAGRVGAAVVIDESPATYLGPAASAAAVVGQVDNLVVLRSVTKGYSWGGLRAGFALGSPVIAARVRELVAPLQIGELAFRAMLRALAAGDLFGRLRARFHHTKPQVIALLRRLGLEVLPGHPDLGWVVVRDRDGAAARLLDELGIRALRFVPSPAARPPWPELLHITVPLSDVRMDELRRRLAPAALAATE